jgi:hypothetical protein
VRVVEVHFTFNGFFEKPHIVNGHSVVFFKDLGVGIFKRNLIHEIQGRKEACVACRAYSVVCIVGFLYERQIVAFGQNGCAFAAKDGVFIDPAQTLIDDAPSFCGFENFSQCRRRGGQDSFEVLIKGVKVYVGMSSHEAFLLGMECFQSIFTDGEKAGMIESLGTLSEGGIKEFKKS